MHCKKVRGRLQGGAARRTAAPSAHPTAALRGPRMRTAARRTGRLTA